jgi:hypothetical protein
MGQARERLACTCRYDWNKEGIIDGSRVFNSIYLGFHIQINVAGGNSDWKSI